MQKRSEATRTRILQAAYTLFGEVGYASTGVAEICTAAGVSKGAFYHHFSSKQAVFIELVNNWLEVIDRNLLLPFDTKRDIPTTLISMTGMFNTIFQQNNEHLPIFLEIWLQAIRDPIVWETLIAPYRRYQAYFDQLLLQGIQNQSIHIPNSNLAARALLGIAIGLLLQGILEPEKSDWPEVAHEGIRIFVNGLQKEQI